MKRLYGIFPREVGKKRKVVRNQAGFDSHVNANNGFASMVSTSLYGFEWADKKGVYETAIIDKLLFDFDDSKGYDPLGEARKLDTLFAEYDVERIRVLSGGGIHVVPMVNPILSSDLMSPSAAIRNAIVTFSDKAEIKRDDGVGVYLAQHVRVLGTWNGGSGCYCIPLEEDEFQDLTLPQLRRLAKWQRPLEDSMFVGTKKIDLTKFDEMPTPVSTLQLDIDDVEITNQDIDKLCMEIEPEASNKERYILISSLVEKGFSKNSIKQYLSKVLSPEKLSHVLVEGQLDAIFDRALVCYNCQRIRAMGYCKETPDNPCPYEYKEF